MTFVRPKQRSKMSKPKPGKVRHFIKSTVSQEKVVLFCHSKCCDSNLSRKFLKKFEHPVTIIEMDQRDDGPEIRTQLAVITGFLTVPQLFINGKFVGEGYDVIVMYETGKLHKLLAELN